MRTLRPVAARGFTLIEVMIVVAIIGILSSVAIPAFRQMDMRAKTAERGGIVRAIRSSLNSLRVKDGSFGPAPIAGGWNPAEPLATTKRPFVANAAGWDRLDLGIEGRLFYSYEFTATEAAAPMMPFFLIQVRGDIDGNGEEYAMLYRHDLENGAFVMTSDLPDPLYEHAIF
jgi:prepilin-type N-terminal cleavage/methylation domain-containing protein